MVKDSRNPPNNQIPQHVSSSISDEGLRNAFVWPDIINNAFLKSRHFTFIATDNEGLIRLFNSGAERMLGYAAKEMVDHTRLEDILDPGPARKRSEGKNRIIKGRTSPGFETINTRASVGSEDSFDLSFLHKNGDLIPVIVSVSPLKNNFDEVLGYLLICTDNTIGQQTEEKLHESETRFRTLFEQAAVGVALLETRTGRYVDINQKYCDFLGYTREEMINSNFQSVTHFEDVQENVDYNAMLLSGKFKEFSIDKRYIRKDGSIVWGNLTVSPLWGPDEEPKEYYHIAVVLDINDRKLSEMKSEYLSMHDALTGLYNRGFFTASLERLGIGRAFPISILVADVDKLKITNDRDGHAAGDELLKRSARVLKETFRGDDIIARIGGDEFCVLLPGTSLAQANELVDRFFSILEVHNLASGTDPLRISCGICTAEKGDSLLETFKKADAQMYLNKKKRKTA